MINFPKLKEAIWLIYTDYRRYRVTEKTGFIRAVFFTQGFWACFVYRIAHYVYYYFKIPILRQLLLAVFLPWQKLVEVMAGIYLPYRCHVGKGLYICHFGSIIINTNARIGDNCNLSQGVTLGIKHSGKYQGVPTLGNRVYVGPNAILIGGIEIGDDAAIGAGAIVTKPVPPRGVAVGNPASILSCQGSFEYVSYDHDESDTDRQTSLKLRADS